MNKAVIISSLAILSLVSSCQKWSSEKEKGISNFPPEMVGAWVGPLGIQDMPNWTIVFEGDGSISKFYSRIFLCPLVVQEGGIHREGQDPGTYMIIGLGPVETEYNPFSKMLKVKIVTEEYEMKLPAGTLEGRMIDTFIGKVSEDGKTWKAEWRNYSWLKGAQEPDIKYIDEHPDDVIVFEKFIPSDPNTKNQ